MSNKSSSILAMGIIFKVKILNIITWYKIQKEAANTILKCKNIMIKLLSITLSDCLASHHSHPLQPRVSVPRTLKIINNRKLTLRDKEPFWNLNAKYKNDSNYLLPTKYTVFQKGLTQSKIWLVAMKIVKNRIN